MIEVKDERGLSLQVKASPRVLALFYASWCPFCRNFLNVFSKHAQTPGALEFIRVRIDEDENPLWEKYSLEAVPSLVLFEKGEVSRRLDCDLGEGLTEKQFSRWLKGSC